MTYDDKTALQRMFHPTRGVHAGPTISIKSYGSGVVSIELRDGTEIMELTLRFDRARMIGHALIEAANCAEFPHA